jgi:hypothetical protein
MKLQELGHPLETAGQEFVLQGATVRRIQSQLWTLGATIHANYAKTLAIARLAEAKNLRSEFCLQLFQCVKYKEKR